MEIRLSIKAHQEKNTNAHKATKKQIAQLLTKGKYLWTRTIGSTLVGEGVDTLLFVSIAFYGVISGEILFLAILSGYAFKVAYEIIATPITYKIVGFLKKAESTDYYDYNTKFTPFKLK